VTGRVKIVFDPSKIKTFEPNTILVTGMTRPEYLHLFQQAIAVVTDAGGVLSHAAITSRELKKPTIVGTEKASKILKDGDLVEVDADNGIVRIIKRA
jgi:pyruvate,water dikinase